MALIEAPNIVHASNLMRIDPRYWLRLLQMGRKGELAYQIAKQGRELQRDIEQMAAREDLADVIYNIAPTESPFVQSITRGVADKVEELHEWFIDDLQPAVDVEPQTIQWSQQMDVTSWEPEPELTGVQRTRAELLDALAHYHRVHGHPYGG